MDWFGKCCAVVIAWFDYASLLFNSLPASIRLKATELLLHPCRPIYVFAHQVLVQWLHSSEIQNVGNSAGILFGWVS